MNQEILEVIKTRNFKSLNLKELFELYKYASLTNNEILDELAIYISELIVDMNPELIKEFF